MKQPAIEHNELISSIPEIIRYGNVLSVEGDGFVHHINSFFKSHIEELSGIFRSNSERFDHIDKKELNAYARKLYNLRTKINKLDRSVTMDKVKHITIPVTLGLNVPLLEAFEILSQANREVSANLLTVIDSTDTMVNKLLGDKDYRISVTPVKPSSKLVKGNKLLKESIGKLIHPDSNLDRVRIDVLLHNISGLMEVYTGAMDNAGNHNTKYLGKVEKDVIKISANVDELYQYFKTNDDVKFDKEKLTEFAETIDLTAQYVTSAITIIHITNQMFMTLIHVIEQLEKRSK